MKTEHEELLALAEKWDVGQPINSDMVVRDIRAILSRYPAEPRGELRKKVLAQFEKVSAEVVLSSNPEGSQMLEGQWYISKWGCDTLEHILDVLPASDEALGEAIENIIRLEKEITKLTRHTTASDETGKLRKAALRVQAASIKRIGDNYDSQADEEEYAAAHAELDAALRQSPSGKEGL